MKRSVLLVGGRSKAKALAQAIAANAQVAATTHSPSI